LLVKYNTTLQNYRQKYANDLLDGTIAMTPHLLDLEKCVPLVGNLFVLVIPFYTIYTYRYTLPNYTVLECLRNEADPEGPTGFNSQARAGSRQVVDIVEKNVLNFSENCQEAAATPHRPWDHEWS
jgi:hypothetical protein